MKGDVKVIVSGSSGHIVFDESSLIKRILLYLISAILEYNDAYTLMNDKGVRLFVERNRAVDVIDNVKNLVNSIANHPKDFDADFEEIESNRKQFRDSCEFADKELQAARTAAGGMGAGMAAGASVAFMAPTAAMWMNEIASMVTELVKSHQSIPEDEPARFSSAEDQREMIGTCPRCGSPVYEGRKNYYCSNRACEFCLWKESKWLAVVHTKVTKKMAGDFMKNGRAKNITLYSEKKGRNFEADLVMEDTGKYINYRMEFPKRKEKKKS